MRRIENSRLAIGMTLAFLWLAAIPVPPAAAAPGEADAVVPEAATVPVPEAATAPVPEGLPEANDASVPEAKTSLLPTTKGGGYDVPMSFEPTESGLIVPDPEINYDLTLDEGKTLRIGDVLINSRSFAISLRPFTALDPVIGRAMGAPGRVPGLALRWPEALFSAGTLEMISRTGQVLWTLEITPAAARAWKDRVAKFRARRSGKTSTALFATQFWLDRALERVPPFRREGETFRFCLTQRQGRGESRLCSKRFQTRKSAGEMVLSPVPTVVQPRVVVMNENGALKAAVPVKAGAIGQFYADLAGGESFDFLAKPSPLNLVDIATTETTGVLRLSGFGVRPLEPSVVLNPDQYGSLTRLFGWEPTIGDARKFWAAALKVERPLLYFPGEGGGLFRQRFQLAAIPREAMRLHLERGAPISTYSSEPELRGRKQASTKVSTNENSVAVDPRDPTFFRWKYRAAETGEINRSGLTVSDEEGHSYRAFYEIYRGKANELSGRFSAIAGSGSLVFVGEAAYNHWFENWFGWNQYWLTRQRWGVSAKAFHSITPIPVGSEKANLDVLTGDLKYRFTPGLWTRDETFGLMGSYQNITFSDMTAPMAGAGVFWARSMPRSLNDMFNLLPFMDAPKWVDMEFIYYAQSLKSGVTLDNSMALNFHGQVLWGKSFFGEAGFGYKRYAFFDEKLAKGARLNTFYATAGLGIKF